MKEDGFGRERVRRGGEEKEKPIERIQPLVWTRRNSCNLVSVRPSLYLDRTCSEGLPFCSFAPSRHELCIMVLKGELEAWVMFIYLGPLSCPMHYTSGQLCLCIWEWPRHGTEAYL